MQPLADLIIDESPCGENRAVSSVINVIPNAPHRMPQPVKRRILASREPRVMKLRRKLDYSEATAIDKEKETPASSSSSSSADSSASTGLSLPYLKKLGRDRYMAVKEWRGETLTHLRIYLELPPRETGGELMVIPTKKGVALNLLQLDSLLRGIDMVKEAVTEVPTDKDNDGFFSLNLGGGKYCTVKVYGGHVFVDFRRFFKPEEEILATKQGVMLALNEWNALVELIDVIRTLVPELDNVIPCISRDDHQNQLGYLRCSECNPFSCKEW